MRRIKNKTILFVGISILAVLGYIAIANGDLRQYKPGATLVLKPDLVVTCIYFEKCGCQCGRTDFNTHRFVRYSEDLKVSVKNVGNAASGPCKLKIEFYDLVTSGVVSGLHYVKGLAPNEEKIIDTRVEYLWRPSYGITATIDATAMVDEANEGNNSLKVNECQNRSSCTPLI